MFVLNSSSGPHHAIWSFLPKWLGYFFGYKIFRPVFFFLHFCNNDKEFTGPVNPKKASKFLNRTLFHTALLSEKNLFFRLCSLYRGQKLWASLGVKVQFFFRNERLLSGIFIFFFPKLFFLGTYWDYGKPIRK